MTPIVRFCQPSARSRHALATPMNGKDASKVRACLASLDTTQRYAVLMYYADELTTSEIGLVLNLSQSQVRQILDRFRVVAAQALESPATRPRPVVRTCGTAAWPRPNTPLAG